MNSLEIDSVSNPQPANDWETKKVKFKEDDGIADVDMLEYFGLLLKGSKSSTRVSWKQILIGKGVHNQDEQVLSAGNHSDGDFEFLEGDVKNLWLKLSQLLSFWIVFNRSCSRIWKLWWC